MCRRVLDWYHFYINHQGGSRLSGGNREACYWKGLGTQEELYSKPCKICQHFKYRKTLYGNLIPKKLSEPKPWDLGYVYLIGLYSKSRRQHHLVGTIIRNNVSLTYMTMIDPATG